MPNIVIKIIYMSCMAILLQSCATERYIKKNIDVVNGKIDSIVTDISNNNLKLNDTIKPIKQTKQKYKLPKAKDIKNLRDYRFTDFYTFEDRIAGIKISAELNGKTVLIRIKQTNPTSLKLITMDEINESLVVLNSSGRRLSYRTGKMAILKNMETAVIKLEINDMDLEDTDYISILFKTPDFYTEIDFIINLPVN